MSKRTDKTPDPRICVAEVLPSLDSLLRLEETSPSNAPRPSQVSWEQGGAEKEKEAILSRWENFSFIDLEAVLDSWHFHIWPAGRRPCLAARRPMIVSNL